MSNLGNKETMAKNIARLMELKGVQPVDVYTALGFSPSTFSDWLHGKTYPRIDKIEMMANYFHCSKADLVEEPLTVPKYVPGTVEVIDLYSKLSTNDRETVLNLLRSMAKQ